MTLILNESLLFKILQLCCLAQVTSSVGTANTAYYENKEAIDRTMRGSKHKIINIFVLIILKNDECS